jgi:hypothetical protein
VSGYNYTQPGAITTLMPVNTSENPLGKPVMSQGQSNGARFVSLTNPAGIGALNGPGPHSYFAYFSPVTFSGFSLAPMIVRDTAIGVSPNSWGICGVATSATAGFQLTYYQTSANGTSQGAPAGYTIAAGLWHSVAWVNNGAGTVSFYINGAYYGQATGIVRSLVSVSTISFGLQSGAGLATPANVGHTKLAGAGAWTGDIGAARIAELHAYYRSWQP